MILSLCEFMTWTDLSVIELWVYVASLFVSSIMMALKLHKVFELTTMDVFLPFYIGIGINAYILFVVFMRAYVEYKTIKGPLGKLFVNAFRVTLIATFTVFISKKIEGAIDQNMPKVIMEYSIAFVPIWVMMAALALQVCRSTSH